MRNYNELACVGATNGTYTTLKCCDVEPVILGPAKKIGGM